MGGGGDVEGKKAFVKLVKIGVKVTESSIQFKMLYIRSGKKSPSALHTVSETFPRCCH